MTGDFQIAFRSVPLDQKNFHGPDMKSAATSGLLVLALSFVFCAPAQAQLFGGRSKADTVAAQAAKESLDDLIRDVEHLHPVAMVVLAKRLFDAGRLDDSVFWFYEGQLRWRAYLIENKLTGPMSEADSFSVFMEDFGPDINWCAADNIPALIKTYDMVLDWDAAHPDDFTPKGKTKDDVREGLKKLQANTVAQQDTIKKAHDDKIRTCPLNVVKTADDPYPGDGGALFGVPGAMVTDYDPNRFAALKIGTTSKNDVVKALGAPESWYTDKDGSSGLRYSYHKSLGVPGFGLVQRVNVSFKFSDKKILTEIVLPKD